MTIKEIVKESGLSQTDFAKKFGIPLRTVQAWCTDVRTPPEYLPQLLEQSLRFDGTPEEQFVKLFEQLTDPKTFQLAMTSATSSDRTLSEYILDLIRADIRHILNI